MLEVIGAVIVAAALILFGLGLMYLDIIIPDSTGNAMKAKLVYVRNHSNRKDWVCFVCTDMTLDEEKILRAYTMRWKIETYFKMSKSYLKLRTECHSRAFPKYR